MNTERIELSDGDWAVVRSRMSHGTSVAMQQALPADVIEVEGEARAADGSPLAKEIQSEMTDVLILTSVTEWSYGRVDKATMGQMPEQDYIAVSRRLEELYSSTPLVPQNASL